MAERRLGQFRLVKQIASGGMAEIHLAVSDGVEGFEKPLALKVIHPNFSSDPDFVRMLVDEAKLAVQLQHPHIVQTYDLGRVGETHYIVMELVEGTDLFRLMRRAAELDRDVPFPVAACIAAAVAEGLDYAHHKTDAHGRPLGIVHRDVSPQNVLISHTGDVKLCDFGIAKVARSDNRTAAGIIKGKYCYMSPEQAWGDPIDARTDIFSTGVLLYEMIVGQMLYLEEDLERLLGLVRRADVAPPSMYRPDVPPELEAIVMRALRKRREERFETAGELHQALEAWLRANAPEVGPQRVGQFVVDVLGGPAQSEGRSQPRARDPRAMTPAVPPRRDHNSLIYGLEEGATHTDLPRGLVQAPGGAGRGTSALDDEEDAEFTMVDDGGFARDRAEGARAPAERTVRAWVPAPEHRDAAVLGAEAAEEHPTVELDPPWGEAGKVLVESMTEETLPSGPQHWGGRSAEESTSLTELPPPPAFPRKEPDELRTEETVVARPDERQARWPPPVASGKRAEPEPDELESPSSFEETVVGHRRDRGGRASLHTPAEGASTLGPHRGARGELQPYGPSQETTIRPLPEGKRRARWKWIALLGALVLLGGGITVLMRPGAQARGVIEVTSAPADASIELDGVRLAQRTPARLEGIDPRMPHRISLHASGYQPWERFVVFPVGRDLEVLQAELVPAAGVLRISTEPPGAEVRIGGQLRGASPLELRDIPAGRPIEVELRLPGHRLERRVMPWKERLELMVNLEPLGRAKGGRAPTPP